MSRAANIFSVKEINQYVKRLLERDVLLKDLWVTGEISNIKKYASGHVYLTLKDKDASISAVIWRSNAEHLSFLPKDGDFVLAYGYITLYEKAGTYQLYIESMEPVGIGKAYARFEALKEKLSAEGLFSPSHKKTLPVYPESVAVVTSETGAVIQDIINVTGRRNKNVRLFLVPALVQGDNAPDSLVAAIKTADGLDCDILIVARGGGSLEDLMAFNDEAVARAIFGAKTPVVSAVGHETDYTIADFVADLRAPTPSAAAEICVPLLSDMLKEINNARQLAENAVQSRLQAYGTRLSAVLERPVLRNPEAIILNKELLLDTLLNKLHGCVNNNIKAYEDKLAHMLEKLHILSPDEVLKRGYSITYNAKNEVLTDAALAGVSDRVRIRLKNGALVASVDEIVR